MRRTLTALTVALASLGATTAGSAGASAPPVDAVPAAQPGVYGSAFLVQTAGGAVTRWTSVGALPEATKLSQGKWRVSFPGITGNFGIANVSSGTGLPASTCAIDTVAPHNGSMAVTLHCNNAAGSAANAGFAVYYTSDPIKAGWARADKAAIGEYVPLLPYNWKGYDVTVDNDGVGVSSITYEGLDSNQPSPFHMMSAVGTGARVCANAGVDGWDDVVAEVRCRNPKTGAFVEATYNSHLLNGHLFKPSNGQTGYARVSSSGSFSSVANSTGPIVGVEVLGKGHRRVFFGSATSGPRLSMVVPSAATPDARCNSSVAPGGSTASVIVKCWNAAKQPVDVGFDVVYFGANGSA